MASVWNCNINRQGRQEPSETSTAKIAKDAKNCIFEQLPASVDFQFGFLCAVRGLGG